MKKINLGVILCSVLLFGASCNQTETAPVTSLESQADAAAVETEATPEAEQYPYDIVDYDGQNFTILNCVDDLWPGMNQVIDFDETTGDSYEDAMYTRNRQAEEALNMKLVIVKGDYVDLSGMVEKSVAAGDDAYQVAYVPLDWSGVTPLSGTYGLNLYDIGTIHLNEEWWNQTFAEGATILDGKLYTAIDYVNMMGYSYSNVLYFNKDIVRNIGLDMPYDMVRTGKWTYDVFSEYIKEGTNLNGDTAFSDSMDANCIYGYGVQHKEGTMSFLNGSGESFVTKDSDGTPTLKTDITRFVNVYDKADSILSGDGYLLMLNEANHTAQTLFEAGRVLFWQGSLGISMDDFRSTPIEYGVLPLPKYDEEQDRYYTMVSEYSLTTVIPKSVTDPEKVGAVLDYMSFLGFRDVIPTLQTSFCYKGLQDEDSIEMFDIILNTLTVDIGYMYGWTSSLQSSLSEKLGKGKGNVASDFEKKTATMEKAIAKTLAAMQE